MIKHIVMWKLKESEEGKNKLENAEIIKAKLESLKNKIEQIKSIEVGINVNSSKFAYDVVLYSEFNAVEDLNIYQKHPEHLKAAEFVVKVTELRAVVDYESESTITV